MVLRFVGSGSRGLVLQWKWGYQGQCPGWNLPRFPLPRHYMWPPFARLQDEWEDPVLRAQGEEASDLELSSSLRGCGRVGSQRMNRMQRLWLFRTMFLDGRNKARILTLNLLIIEILAPITRAHLTLPERQLQMLLDLLG